MNRLSRRKRSLIEVFAVPALLALATMVGLVAGLTGQGAPDVFAWLLLALPLGALALSWAWRSRIN